MNEFEIIDHYFKFSHQQHDSDLLVEIGDDAAVVDIPAGQSLVTSTDTLICDVHFPANTTPEDIAFKALAVNLSDIAAMGALPRWYSLSLTIPDNDTSWLAKFSKNLHAVANHYALVLIGGDLTKGPLSITITIQGLIPKGQAILRSGARSGDMIYVSGTLGGAAYALKSMLDNACQPPTKKEQERLRRPTPRVSLGIGLRHVATSCIDISDGLYADLMHILKASRTGAKLYQDKIPLTESLTVPGCHDALETALFGGDDYELCFTLPTDVDEKTLTYLNSIIPIQAIGKITENIAGIHFADMPNSTPPFQQESYRHF